MLCPCVLWGISWVHVVARNLDLGHSTLCPYAEIAGAPLRA